MKLANIVRFATESLIDDLLPVVDDFDVRQQQARK